MKLRAWIELGVAVLAAVVGIVTVVHPTWFEALFAANPDGGSGALERAMALALIATSAGLSFCARRDIRRLNRLEA